MSSTQNLTAKARFLKNAAPRAYDEFLQAFIDYAHAAAGIMIAANENLQLYQGHAQQCLKLLNALEEARDG